MQVASTTQGTDENPRRNRS